MMTAIRRGGAGDLDAVAAIQYCCPEAAHWEPRDYLAHDFYVVTVDDCVAGFLVMRLVAPDEGEILNIAVAPAFRRIGLGKRLMEGALEHFRGAVFLEVRESNTAARRFYQTIGFKEVSRREGYYSLPTEAAIVLTFHSC